MLINIEPMDTIRVFRMDNEGENKFTKTFISAFNSALDSAEADAGVRALVITGTHEKYFSTGLDLTWLMSSPKDQWLPFFLDMDRLLLRVFTFPKPVVAAINGHAFAGGLFLALTADYRIMREDRGYCCMPEIDLGIDLPPGTVALISHVLGRRNAERISLTAKKFSAAEALAIGEVDELASKDQLVPRAIRGGQAVCGQGPQDFCPAQTRAPQGCGAGHGRGRPGFFEIGYAAR